MECGNDTRNELEAFLGGSCDRGCFRELSERTVNGTVTVSNLDVSAPSATRTSFSGRLGDGNGMITLTTINGAITLTGF